MVDEKRSSRASCNHNFTEFYQKRVVQASYWHPRKLKPLQMCLMFILSRIAFILAFYSRKYNWNRVNFQGYRGLDFERFSRSEVQNSVQRTLRKLYFHFISN